VHCGTHGAGSRSHCYYVLLLRNHFTTLHQNDPELKKLRATAILLLPIETLGLPRRIIPNFIKNGSTASKSCTGGHTDRITMSQAASSPGTRNKLVKSVHGRHISWFNFNVFQTRLEVVLCLSSFYTTHLSRMRLQPVRDVEGNALDLVQDVQPYR
jgi:hypothetical protein